MIARWLIALVVVAALVGTILLGRTVRAPQSAPTDRTSDTDPGYSARDAEIIETGDDGRPRYWLNATLIQQPSNDPTVTLTQPALRYLDKGGGSWRAHADTGSVSPGRDIISLDGDVQLDGTLADGGAPAHIETPHLVFDTAREVASTTDRVTIDWSGHRLVARGLRADLRAETLRLESAVHGRFLPQ
ncbi:MAG: Lipopolysaccharide export system protein LptC [Steroidobacteraceae bacterium]|nr:Lipopolysaccharide export system protein LptC [Steroidobacteraceae bacterium]